MADSQKILSVDADVSCLSLKEKKFASKLSPGGVPGGGRGARTKEQPWICKRRYLTVDTEGEWTQLGKENPSSDHQAHFR